MTAPEITADRLLALADGPALDLPPVHWEAPMDVTSAVARWGGLPWEPGEADRPNVYLCAYGNLIEVGDERYTPAEARIALNRLASAIAMAEEVSR